MTHHVSLGTDARGNITRIDNALSGIAEKLEKTQEKLAVTLQQVEDAKAEAAKVFPQEQELREKSARLAELVGQEMGPSVQVDESKPSVLDDLRAKSEQVASSACRNGRYEEKSL